MKKATCKIFLFVGVLISTMAQAQSGNNLSKSFKDITQAKESEQHFQQEIKKKELLKAPSLLYIDKTDRIIKKDKKRRKKN